MQNKKPLVVMDLSTTGKGGGPFTSTSRVMNSLLNEKYSFRSIDYDTKLGEGISWKRILNLRDQIKKLDPDIVHFTGLQLSGFHMAIACKMAGVKKTVVTIRGFSGDAIGFNPIKKCILTYILEPLTILLTSRHYGVSKYVTSRKIVRLFSYKGCGHIYNFPPERYLKIDGKNIRTELSLSANDVVVVSVARIIKDKGYHILDEAILKFSDNPQLKFVIVGEGAYLEEMKEKLKVQIANRQVFFLGYREDIQFILEGCDIFILPTLHETLSVALLEASMQGLALIASDTGGVPEIVKNNYNGFLIEPGDTSAFKDAIDKLSRDKALRDKFSKNAMKHIEEQFSNASIIRKIDQVYQGLLNIG